MFDSPASYYNPTRNPAPSRTFYASGGVDLSGGRGKGAQGAQAGLHMSAHGKKTHRVKLTYL